MCETNEIIEDGDYKCSKCKTFTVEKTYEWGVWETAMGEELGPVYTCKKCGENSSIRDYRDSYKEGDTIDMN